MRFLAAVCGAAFLAPALAAAQAPAMSDAQYTKVAESGAAPAIGSKAAIARIDAKGAVTGDPARHERLHLRGRRPG